MRPEQLMNLIKEEQERREPAAPIKKASKKSLQFISFRGLVDEDIERIIVPQIVDWELSGEFSKDKLKRFIDEHPEIRKLPLPMRHAVDKTPDQRRMDSLARLLSVDNKYTPCVAMAFYQGELIVSSNSPNPRELMRESALADCLARKMGLIQNFLIKMTQNIAVGSQPDIKEIQFSSRTRILATETILQITHPQNGGVGDVVPSNKEARHKQRGSVHLHLENALLKLARHCLLGIYTKGKKGFSLAELDALLKADTLTVVMPNTEVLQKGNMHAEQAILYYLQNYTDYNEAPLAERLNIGISKLCCQACHAVLSRQEDKISYRGSHGMNFPSVYDIDTEALYEGADTRLGADLCPSDSESECEFFDDEIFDEDDVPGIEALAAENAQSTVRNTAKLRFFQSCAMEEAQTQMAKSTENIPQALSPKASSKP